MITLSKPSLRVAGILAAVLVAGLAAGADPPEVRGLYAASFDANTQSKLDGIIADAVGYGFNAIFLQVRSRGDAFYFPNRDDATYPNPEPRGQMYSISPPDLDTLQYVIDRAHENGIEVHAWVTVLPIWNRATLPADPAHAYRAHPAWVTEDASGTTMSPTTDSEGAYLDPGIPDVQDYTYNVFMDIVRNYDIDGVHLDYVRFKGTGWGYDPVTKSRFLADTGLNIGTQATFAAGAWNVYRRHQLTTIVKRVNDRMRIERPNALLSAYLIGYQDSIRYNFQGYNWWSAHDAVDVLCGGYYGTSLTEGQTRYNMFQDNNHGGKPMVMPLGAEAVAFGNTPAQMRTFITSFRADARPPVGFVHFDISGLQADADALLLGLTSQPTYPYYNSAAIPASLRPGADTTPPNAPANVTSSKPSANAVRVTFDRPAAAADGDLPVQYRVYRSGSASVPLRYGNLQMVFWDLDGARSSFSWDDNNPLNGANYYKVAAYDDFNNDAVAGPTSQSATQVVYIIETRTGGQHYSNYSETGTWTDSSAHSTAAGLTPALGSRFALPGDANGRNDRARFQPNLPSGGFYEIFLTTHQYSSANALNAQMRVAHADGTSTFNRDVTYTQMANTWVSLGTYRFNAGTGGYLEVNNTTQSNIGTSTDSRLAPCAARFVSVGGESVPWETRPAVVEPTTLPETVVVDNGPYRLDYEDGTGWGNATAYLGSYYGGNARYSNAHPSSSAACWVAEIPADGFYRIEGHVRGNSSFSTAATYRFRDATGLQTVTTTQRNGGSSSLGYWSIEIDGGTPRYFEQGPVYVTVYDAGTTGYTLIADAIRFVPATVVWDRIEMY